MIKKLDVEFELEGADEVQYLIQRVINKLNELTDKVNKLSGEQDSRIGMTGHAFDEDTGWMHDTTNGPE